MLSELLKTLMVEVAQDLLAKALVRRVILRFASTRESRRRKRFLRTMRAVQAANRRALLHRLTTGNADHQ